MRIRNGSSHRTPYWGTYAAAFLHPKNVRSIADAHVACGTIFRTQKPRLEDWRNQDQSLLLAPKFAISCDSCMASKPAQIALAGIAQVASYVS